MGAVALVTKAEYAKRRGVNPSSVTRAIEAGRITIVVRDGKEMIDPEVADIQWERNTEAKYRPVSTSPAVVVEVATPGPNMEPAPLYDRALAAAKREYHEAHLAQMREEERAGALVERAQVVRAATNAGAQLRTTLERLPGLSLELAAMTDPMLIRARLTAAVNEALTDLADNLRGLCSGHAEPPMDVDGRA